MERFIFETPNDGLAIFITFSKIPITAEVIVQTEIRNGSPGKEIKVLLYKCNFESDAKKKEICNAFYAQSITLTADGENFTAWGRELHAALKKVLNLRNQAWIKFKRSEDANNVRTE